MAVKRFQFLVHGTVQGVFFRVHTVDAAKANGITGWVRNSSSGKVEGEAQGEEENLRNFFKLVDQGPPAAKVVRVDKTEMELKRDEQGFTKMKTSR